MTHSGTLRLEKALLFLWLLVNLTLGALTVHPYGISVDEPNNQRYAADTLKAYPSLFGILYEPYYDSSYEGHGPAFVTLAALFVQGVRIILPAAHVPDIWHFSYFVTFLLAGLCLYWLVRRWFQPWTAWAILLLFTTQPLLLGHAFINPKDIPFMFFLTLAVLWGLRMGDTVSAPESYVSLQGPAALLARRFRNADPAKRRRFLRSLCAAAAGALLWIVLSGEIDSLLGRLVMVFHQAPPESWTGQLFRLAGSPGIPAEQYVLKATRLLDRLERGLWAAGLIFFTAYFGLLISGRTPKDLLREAWGQRHVLASWMRSRAGSLKESLSVGRIGSGAAAIGRELGRPTVLLAGLALGLATGVRAIGPLAGVIAILDLYARGGSKAGARAAAYAVVTGIVTYISWPRLWGAPLQRYLAELGVISDFPNFPGRVLFQGQLHGARDLPASYLPVLLNIQLTEPMLLCFYVGLGLLLWRLLRGQLRSDLLLYVGLGFGVPLLSLILLNSTLYNNFRQALFIIPAMFLVAAFALESAFHHIARTPARLLLVIVLALPGIFSTARLYPYQYVYYNSLVGGTSGAVYRYEMDYWRISLREVALELNEVASPGSVIVVTRSAGLLARYSRPDLVIDKPINSILDLDQGYDYLVQVTRREGEQLYREVEPVVVVERAGAILATAKYVRNLSAK